jgi:4-aminobutyrate aminotransferase-like enzyme
MDNAATVGGYFRQGLEDLHRKHALIGDVRGMGLMQAMEFVKDRVTKEPAVQETVAFMEECRKRGLLIGKGGLMANVIRMSPPMNIAKSDVDEAIRIMDETFTTIQPMVAAARR